MTPHPTQRPLHPNAVQTLVPSAAWAATAPPLAPEAEATARDLTARRRPQRDLASLFARICLIAGSGLTLVGAAQLVL